MTRIVAKIFKGSGIDLIFTGKLTIDTSYQVLEGWRQPPKMGEMYPKNEIYQIVAKICKGSSWFNVWIWYIANSRFTYISNSYLFNYIICFLLASTSADSVSICYLDLDWIACMVTYGDSQMRHIRIDKSLPYFAARNLATLAWAGCGPAQASPRFIANLRYDTQ